MDAIQSHALFFLLVKEYIKKGLPVKAGLEVEIKF